MTTFTCCGRMEFPIVDRISPRVTGGRGFVRASALAFLLLSAVVSSPLRSQAADPSLKEIGPDPVNGRPPVPRAGLSMLPVSLFRTHCLKCHDADGRGEIARDTLRSMPYFTDARWQDSQTDDQLSHAILEGQGKSMPTMKHKMSRAEVGRLVVLVHAFRGGRLVLPDEEEGSEPSTKADVPPAWVARTGPLPVPNVQEAARRSARGDLPAVLLWLPRTGRQGRHRAGLDARGPQLH